MASTSLTHTVKLTVKRLRSSAARSRIHATHAIACWRIRAKRPRSLEAPEHLDVESLAAPHAHSPNALRRRGGRNPAYREQATAIG
jgi:hypothetical protein